MSEEIIYSQVPKLPIEFAGMKMCMTCSGYLTHRFSRVYVYDVFNNRKAVANIKLYYCEKCGIPYCTAEDERSVKSINPDLHIQAIPLVRNSHINLETQIKHIIFTEPENFNDATLLPEKSIIVVGRGKGHPCREGREGNRERIERTPFKMINQYGKLELRYLYKCKDCGKIFIKSDVYNRNVENYKQYRFVKQDNLSDSPADNIEILLKGSIIHIGKPAEHPCIDEEHKIQQLEIKLKQMNGKKKHVRIRKCIACGKYFLSEKFYDEWKPKLIPYNYVLSESKKKKIKKVLPKTEPSEEKEYSISPKDFLTRVNTFQCSIKNHNLMDITATVMVMNTTGALNQISIPAAYCETCKKYYILEPEYQKLKRHGHIVCKIVEHTYWINKGKGSNPYNLNEESVLHMMGYNVNQQANLSQAQRWGILEIAVDEKIMTRMEICSHLDYLINRSRNKKNFDLAISKWKADREHISNYVIGSRKVEIGKITVNKPKR